MGGGFVLAFFFASFFFVAAVEEAAVVAAALFAMLSCVYVSLGGVFASLSSSRTAMES